MGIDDLKLNDREKAAVKEFAERLKKALGDQLVSIRLFGSKVRGDSGPESDIDIFVLTRDEKDASRGTVATIAAQIWEETDILLSPVTFTVYEKKVNDELRSFFFEAVEREGLSL